MAIIWKGNGWRFSQFKSKKRSVFLGNPSVGEPQWFTAVPVATLEKFRLPFWFRLRFRIQTILSTVFQQKIGVKNLPFSMSEAALFPRKLASHLWFFYFFFIPFYAGSGPKSGSGTGHWTLMHSGSGSAKAKSSGSCGFGSLSTTLPTTLLQQKW